METLDAPAHRHNCYKSATFGNYHHRETAVRLTFIGKDPDSNPTGSPTVYRTDRETWIVQGRTVTDPDALAQMDIPGGEKAGRSVRRVRIVSEPLSDYQRWSYSIAYPMVEAGEDIRWVPRRLVSSVALPGK